MEGGQKTVISLESPIDVKSSDMLVPINNPQFAHNRQKYQGHCLPNSLRFEADGWAAGNTVYNITSDKGEYISGNWKIKRSVLNSNPAYLFEYYYKNDHGLYDYIGNVCFNTESSIQMQSNINRSDIGMTADTLTGEFRGISFSVQVLSETDVTDNVTAQKYIVTVGKDSVTLVAGDTVTVGNLKFQSTVQNNGICVLKILDTDTSTGNIAVQFKKASKVINGEYTVAEYTGTADNVHTYSKYDRYITVDGNNVSVSDGQVTASSFDDNTLTFTFLYTYNTKADINILGVEMIDYLYNCTTEKANGSLINIDIQNKGSIPLCINTSDAVGKVRKIVPYSLIGADISFVTAYTAVPFTFVNMYSSNAEAK